MSRRMCNSGDEDITMSGYAGTCPAERECYTLPYECGDTFCMLPEGVHCTDKMACNPGDIETSFDDRDCTEAPDLCYMKQLCTSYIWCKRAKDAGVAASASDAAVDAQVLDAGRCGDGIVDPGEECDWGTQNGVFQGGDLGTCTLSCQYIPYLP